uniref:Aminotransferase-like plant mobile domain-containing protein n=1 Tax=Hordeum vulgare subsp. vulgare TaxID=112509 RepID=A0A8I6WTQ3_HORVV
MYVQFIGLGGVFKTPSIKIRRVLCLAIANSYDAEQDAFIINRRACRIALEDVAHITGMPCDGKKHVPSNLDDNMELWKKLKDRNDTKITFKGLLAKMKGDSTPNFGRPFVLYTIGKYVCRSKEEYVDNKYIGTVRNVETIKGTNLGQLKLDYLMDGVKNFVNGEAILEGNLPLLQTWYYEKFRVHQLDSIISYESRLRPLI